MSTKIEEFAQNNLGITLTKAQVDMISSMTGDKEILKPRRMGLAVANRVAREYLRDGLSLAAPVATNNQGQPIGDFPSDIPTQAEFDKQHAEPTGYGDEDDHLLISKSMDVEAAFKMIIATLKDWGVDKDYWPKSPNDLATFDVGWGYDHDSYHYSEGTYWICDNLNQVSKRWEAWGVATQ